MFLDFCDCHFCFYRNILISDDGNRYALSIGTYVKTYAMHVVIDKYSLLG